MALFCACTGPDQRKPTATPGPPNLIVILADDLGVETLGCYGGESQRTPHLDRLAAEGVRFENAFTQPLCTPTRVELLTGRSNARNYRAFSVLDPAERTFAEALREHGYSTCAVGKWQLFATDRYPEGLRHTGSLPAQAGFDRHALWQVQELGLRHWGPTLTIDGDTTALPSSSYGPDVALEYALRWIDEPRDAPFVLFWPAILPHGPFIAPPGSVGPHKPPGDVAQFRPMVEHLDTQVGRLVEHLHARGLADETLLLFIGDNGSPRQTTSWRSGVPVPGGKSLLGATGSHVPFILWAPGRFGPGVVIDDPVSTVDVFATLLDAARVALPTDRPLDGWSLLPRLRGEIARHREWVAFHHHPRPLVKPETRAQRWARDARWQLFEDGRLFDLSIDPTLEQAIHAVEESAEAREARARLRRGLVSLPDAGAR